MLLDDKPKRRIAIEPTAQRRVIRRRKPGSLSLHWLINPTPDSPRLSFRLSSGCKDSTPEPVELWRINSRSSAQGYIITVVYYVLSTAAPADVSHTGLSL